MKSSIGFEKRAESGPAASWLIRLGAVLAALLFTFAFLLITGRGFSQIVRIFNVLIVETFFSYYGLMDVLRNAVPLAIAGCGMAFAFRMKLWNTGGEGQIMLGAIAAAGVSILFPDLPGYLLAPLMLLAAFAAGSLWAGVAAIPRAYLNVNETITTLMLNYVAILIAQALIYGPWKDPNAGGFPMAPPIAKQARLPVIPGTAISVGVFIAIALIVIYLLVIKYTRWGYELRVTGESGSAAGYAGINVKRNVLLTLMVSGGIAGIAGFTQLCGSAFRLESQLSSGFGYTAIIIAWLSKLKPTGIVVFSIFMAGLYAGGMAVGTEGLPSSISGMIQGTLLFFVLGAEILTRYRISFRKKEDGENA